MKIDEIIVVEGRDDTVAVQRAVDADTIETGGSALNEEKLNRIRLAQERRGVIVLTDPDYPGERIRKLIDEAVPGCKHAFIPKALALSKRGKLGVEHASPGAIRAALKDVKYAHHKKEEADSEYDAFAPTISTLQAYGLVGSQEASRLRALMGENLGIGYCNAKQFQKRLQSFRVTQVEFEQAYARARQESQYE
ncbi:ribonuclease M5 [Caldalkalibacillus salinus]|uniref:ribonuclease M5 n=1 Tax=Caldalkalibacillus salinus TaxID=2803787 RepID=UPI001922E7D2|nr:ribonuclease M5 [Caldalkalibacillus salinus]